MIEFIIPGPPIPKKRPRVTRYVTYDPQSKEKQKIQTYLMAQMRLKRVLKPLEGPIIVETHFHMPIPKSWPKKRVKTLQEKITPHTSRPDIDNLAKFYFDALNGIAFKDDNLIAKHVAWKRYSENPRTQILIYPWEDSMVTEHAKLIHEQITTEDLLFMIKKANQLGKSGRAISDVYQIKESDGTHVFFEVEDMRHRRAS